MSVIYAGPGPGTDFRSPLWVHVGLSTFFLGRAFPPSSVLPAEVAVEGIPTFRVVRGGVQGLDKVRETDKVMENNENHMEN